MDGGVVLNNSGDFATVLLNELRGPVADSTESLDDESLALNASREAASVDEGLGSEKLANSVVDAKTSGLGATSNTTLRDEFTSAAALSIDIGLTLNVHVGVLDPGHGLLVGAHIGTEAINLGADKALLDELHSVLTGHSLDLVLGVLAGVNLDATLGTTEGDIGNGELEGHEGSESLDFLQIDVVGVTSATFDGELVSGMLCSVASDSLEITVVSTERDVESDDSLASSDESQVLSVNTSGVGGVVVEKLDLLEETGFVVLIELWTELLAGSEMTKACNEQSR